MKTEYLPRFLKDLKALKSDPIFVPIQALVFEEIPNSSGLDSIKNLKKLKGEANAYRIRLGDYRIGFVYDGEILTFYRVLHRKDIYRYFP
jgi:mRNA interferase RelE/StbE